MKKLLALMMALVMTMSLVTISNAAFSDADTIEHDEAVEVMSALGVINGMGDGSFAPKGNVTRAQMAKMITIIMLGDVDASAFVGTATDLTDINGHWAEGYIKYCYSQGVIAGKGNGKFDPDANVSVVEAAKMLCVAIGYNSAVQQYVGADWQINVTRDAQISGFFDELSVTSNKVLTRDEAAQMIYNAIQADTIVKHSSVDRTDGSITDQYLPDGASLLYKTFGALVWVGTYVGNYDNGVANAKGEISVDGKLDTAASGTSAIEASLPSDLDISNIGEEVKVIFKDGKGGISNVPDKKDTIYGVYNTGATEVITAVMNGIKDQKSSDAKINIGGTKYNTTNSVAIYEDYIDSVVYKRAENGGSGVNSDLTVALKHQSNDEIKFVCNDDGKICAAYVTKYVISSVTAVTSTKVTLKNVGTLTIADHDIYSGIAKGDVVVYNKFYSTDKDDALFVVTKAESVEGKLTGYKFSSGKYVDVVVDGTTYPVDDEPTALPALTDDSYTALATGNIGDSVRVYMLNGMAGAVDKISGESSYAIITDVDLNGATGTAAVPSSDLNPWRVVLMLSDGTKVTKIVHKDSETANGTAAQANTIVAGRIVKYTLSGDDKVKFSEVSGAAAAITESGAGNAKVYDATSKKLTTTGTNQVAVAADATLYVKVGTDFYAYNLRSAKDIANTHGTGVSVVTMNNSDNLVIAAYIELTAKPGTSTDATVYGIVTGYVGAREIDNTTYYQYTVAVDADADNNVTVSIENSSSVPTVGDLVAFDVDAKGLYNGAGTTGNDITIITGTKGAVKTFDDANKLITYYTATSRADATSAYIGAVDDLVADTLDKDYKVVYVDKDGNKGGEEIGVNAFDGSTGYANVVLYDEDSDGLVDVIFVETSNQVNLDSTTFATKNMLSLTQTGTNNDGITISIPTSVEVGETFTVTATAPTAGTATVTYNNIAKTITFAATNTATVTFTAVSGQTSITLA